jgi:hypothetical protein
LEVIKNHTSLRSKFSIKDHNVIKLVTEESYNYIDFSIEDLSTSTNSLADIEVLYEQSQDVERTLFGECPLKFVLCKISKDKHVGFISAHHLLGDYKSAVLVGIEVQQEYNQYFNKNNSLSQDRNLSVDALALSTVTDEAKKSFSKYRDDIMITYNNISPIRYKTQDIPITKRSFELNKIMFEIPQNLISAVQGFCSKHHFNEVSFYSTAFALYLGRRENCEQFLMGFPVDLRKGRINQNAIGYLSKPIPVPITLRKSLPNDLISTVNRGIKKAIRDPEIVHDI